jgi:hypothetical protein
MNVPAGFSTGFSFYYAAANNAGTVTVWDGLNGTGNQLASLTLPVTGANCNGSTKSFSCWTTKGVSFTGTAKSVNFSGTANQIGFDNITLNSATPSPSQVPLPPSLILICTGLGSASLIELRRKLKARG